MLKQLFWLLVALTVVDTLALLGVLIAGALRMNIDSDYAMGMFLLLLLCVAGVFGVSA